MIKRTIRRYYFKGSLAKATDLAVIRHKKNKECLKLARAVAKKDSIKHPSIDPIQCHCDITMYDKKRKRWVYEETWRNGLLAEVDCDRE